MQLVFRTLNQARSAFVAINFSPNFFESYTLTSEIFPKCKVLLKVRTAPTRAAIFSSSFAQIVFFFYVPFVAVLGGLQVHHHGAEVHDSLGRGRVSSRHRASVQLRCEASLLARLLFTQIPGLQLIVTLSPPAPGIKKTYRLTFEECEALQAVYSKDNCPNKITSRPRYGRPRAL